MSGLFGGKPKMPPPPKPVRMPAPMDPDVEAAGRRTREAALGRRGRLSTMLTDATGDVVGSSGTKLGA